MSLRVLFLDEPSAGVDVELRKDMWNVVRDLRDSGVTIILTTHYIEEAEEMADRVGVINKGEIDPGRGEAGADGQDGPEAASHRAWKSRWQKLPKKMSDLGFTLRQDGSELAYAYDSKHERPDVAKLLAGAWRRPRLTILIFPRSRVRLKKFSWDW